MDLANIINKKIKEQKDEETKREEERKNRQTKLHENITKSILDKLAKGEFQVNVSNGLDGIPKGTKVLEIITDVEVKPIDPSVSDDTIQHNLSKVDFGGMTFISPIGHMGSNALIMPVKISKYDYVNYAATLIFNP